MLAAAAHLVAGARPAPTWGLGGLGPVTLALVIAAGAVAVVDWVVVSDAVPGLRRAEYATKPAVLVLLVLAATAVAPVSGSMRAWFVAALVLCLVGDVCLMLPGDRTELFAAGLGAFLLAHGCFIVGIMAVHPSLAVAAAALGVLAVLAAAPATLILRAVAGSEPGFLVGPVSVYLVVIVVMAALAWSGGQTHGAWAADPVLGAGALAFVVSDTLLAVNRFVRPFRLATTAVHATYHLAVVLLVLALARVPLGGR